MSMKAIQQIMLGSAFQSEEKAISVLRDVREAGFGGIELCGFMIRKTPPLVRVMTRFAGMSVGKSGSLNWPEMIRESGLHVVGIHEDLKTICENTELIIDETRIFQTEFIVLSGLYQFDFSDIYAVRNLAKKLNCAGEQLKEHKIRLLYHNHNGELR